MAVGQGEQPFYIKHHNPNIEILGMGQWEALIQEHLSLSVWGIIMAKQTLNSNQGEREDLNKG